MSFDTLITNRSRFINDYYKWAEQILKQTGSLQKLSKQVPIFGQDRKYGKTASNVIMSIFYNNNNFDINILLAKMLILCKYMGAVGGTNTNLSGTSCWFENDRPVVVSVVYKPTCPYSLSLLEQLKTDKLEHVKIIKDDWEKLYGIQFPYPTVPQIKIDGSVVNGGYTGYMTTFHPDDDQIQDKISNNGRCIKGTAMGVGLFLVALMLLSQKSKNYGEPNCQSKKCTQTAIAVNELYNTISKMHLSPQQIKFYSDLYNVWLTFVLRGTTEEQEYIRCFINSITQMNCIHGLPVLW